MDSNYCSKPECSTFDLDPPPKTQVLPKLQGSEVVKVNPDICTKSTPTQKWEIDVRQLISSAKWLQTYGLRKSKLDLKGLLPLIGFRHADEYDSAVKKPVCSRYGETLFQKYFRGDGRAYNIACTRDQLRQVESRLSQAITLYKRRLEWLTTESRRIFGVIEEKVVVLILDIRNLSPQQFDQYRSAVERLLREQVSQLANFNIIRATDAQSCFRETCVAVTQQAIEDAIDWLWSLERCQCVSTSATAEAVMKALSQGQLEAIYLVTEGSSCAGSRELLREKLVGTRVPVHIVSYNCTDSATIVFLKELAQITAAKFHAYAVIMEMDAYEGLPVDSATSQANIILKKKTYGGVPSGAGARPDVLLLFEELEEARTTLQQIQAIIEDCTASNNSFERQREIELSKRTDSSETYMSSREWLERHGLKAKRLGFYDVLQEVAFKHQDGVVDLKYAPQGSSLLYQTDSVTREKLVNAKYCERFPHVLWKDGQVMHVQVTPEVHRRFVGSMQLALQAIQARIDWLQQGSRELFGTVIENQIYFLIDTSASMASNIQFVKDKLFTLMQEQLRHKQKFNLVAFDTRAYAWKERLTEVSEKSLEGAWQWVKALECKGSTNTLGALRLALADPATEAIYLLTDGRPDQPPKSVLAQIYLHPKVPIHTISFNCRDSEANDFLCQLAQDTHGRFHYYHENGVGVEGPQPWESEDVRLLREEMDEGQQNMQKIGDLRDECAALAWSAEGDAGRKKNRTPTSAGSVKARQLLPSPPGSARPGSARVTSRPRQAGFIRPHSAPRATALQQRPLSGIQVTGNIAGHTNSSILRMLSQSGEQRKSTYLLPETRKLFDDQLNRLTKRKQMESKKNKKKKTAKTKRPPLDSETMSSKRWLLYHGLAALKLRIIDVLAPTFIPQRPKHVPILNKNVMSRVFDEVLPISHVTEKTEMLHVVNPQAVNLQEYIVKLEEVIAKYYERLNKIVWNALPEEEKEKFGSGPVSFMENKSTLLSILENAAWPVSEIDLVLLEREADQAQHYIKQARDLLAHSHSPERLPEKKEKPVRKVFVNGLIGCRVIARNPTDGFFYPGKVDDVYDIRKVSVKFERLSRLDVATRLVIPLGGAVARPHMMLGDYVLGKVVNDVNGFECYVPGIVYMLPKCTEKSDHCHCRVKFYTVILFNGQKAEFMRNHLVKISKMRYLLLCKFIWDLKPEDRPESIVKERVVKEYVEVHAKDDLSDERARLEEWRLQLEKQYRLQKHEQENLREQARKLAHLRRHLEEAHEHHSHEQEHVLVTLLDDMNRAQQEKVSHHHVLPVPQEEAEEVEPPTAAAERPLGSSLERTEEWLVDHHGHGHVDSGSLLRASTNKTVVVAHETVKPVPPLMFEVRRTAPPLVEGDEVLARWSDEGWYYRGLVKQDCGDYSYIIEDSVGDLEKIWREDIIHDDDDRDKALTKKDAVVALHPHYSGSYAPAVVLGMDGDPVVVRFYDGVETSLAREEMYSILPEKFELDVAFILERERQWVGQAVVARSDRTGAFALALVKEQLDTGKQYVIQWADGSTSEQFSSYMFGAFTKKHPLALGDHVLAVADQASLQYLPGRITKATSDRTALMVEFCDGNTASDVSPDQCFWLSAEYYAKAAKYYRTCQRD